MQPSAVPPPPSAGNGTPAPAPGRANWFARLKRDPQRARLAEEIRVSMARVERLRAELASGDDLGRQRAERVMGLLAQAWAEYERLEIDSGYGFLHLARELEFELVDDVELHARRLELGAEVTAGKYGKWRATTVAALLARADEDPANARGHVAQAARIAMTGASNEYRKLTIRRRHQTILLLVSLPLLVAAVVVTLFHTDEFADITHWWVAVVATLLGAIGGVTSALQRFTRSGGGSIPDRLASYVVSLSRPLLGAVAGFIAYLGQRVVIDNGAAQVGAVLVASFAAGFAERLLPSTGSADEASTPTGDGGVTVAPPPPPAPPAG